MATVIPPDPPYAISGPHIAYHHMLSQYRISHTTIRYFSTGYRIPPYATSVPDIAYRHTAAVQAIGLCQYGHRVAGA
eukprot:2834857-Rhodomonas_salina.1